MRCLVVILFVSFLLVPSFEIFASPIQNGSGTPGDFRSALTGTITVTGHFYYFITTTAGLSVVDARVDIYDDETTYVVSLGSTYTDNDGYFTFGPISNDDGPGEGGLDIIVVVSAFSSAARVIDPSGIIYAAETPTFYNCSDGTFDIGNYFTPYSERGAWWILSGQFGLTRGWKYLHDTVGSTVPQVTIRWPFENWPHYHPGGEIHFPEWTYGWPDVMIHEYAHHVMYSVYGFLPPSMTQHSINLRSNSTTAWAEGWANFFPLAVFNDPIFHWSNGTHSVDIDLEAPTWYTSGWDNGDQVEGHVAGALWDIFDSANDGYDTFSNGFTHIWNVLSNQTDNTFRQFWQAWCLGNYQKRVTLMAIFQNSIDYRGLGDVNADGIVDIYDQIILSGAWGSRRGQANWDQRADLNYDDVIDIYDAIILAQNYGHHYDC